jgi:hypothetical protein
LQVQWIPMATSLDSFRDDEIIEKALKDFREQMWSEIYGHAFRIDADALEAWR